MFLSSLDHGGFVLVGELGFESEIALLASKHHTEHAATAPTGPLLAMGC
jgi:hypothetical protein